MVEGGTRIISSFLSQKLVDHLVLTIAMMFINGFHLTALHNGVSSSLQISRNLPRLNNPGCKWLGDDLIIWGDFVCPDST